MEARLLALIDPDAHVLAVGLPLTEARVMLPYPAVVDVAMRGDAFDAILDASDEPDALFALFTRLKPGGVYLIPDVTGRIKGTIQRLTVEAIRPAVVSIETPRLSVRRVIRGGRGVALLKMG